MTKAIISFIGRVYVLKQGKKNIGKIHTPEELTELLKACGFNPRRVKYEPMKYYNERDEKVLYKIEFELLASDNIHPSVVDLDNFFKNNSMDYKGKIVKYTFD